MDVANHHVFTDMDFYILFLFSCNNTVAKPNPNIVLCLSSFFSKVGKKLLPTSTDEGMTSNVEKNIECSHCAGHRI